ncbi:MAG: endonuclease NucS [Pyrobaculum sp.]|jgi:predicted RecB family endonuclease
MGARFERYVLDLLPALGLIPKANRYRIYKNGVEVGEVDILAVDEKGDLYAIEVKAGRVDVSGIRQAYINARLIEAKPLVIARGYADDAARQLAKELNVEVILLPDYIFLSIDDLYTVFTNSLARLLTVLLEITLKIEDEELNQIIKCPDVQCLCEEINCDVFFTKLPREAKNYDLLKTVAILKALLPQICQKAALNNK